MKKLFDNICEKDKKKLEQNLEAITYTFHKNQSISKYLKDHIIGIILNGKAKIIHTDYNGNSLVVDELYENSIFGSNISFLYNSEYEIIAYEETKVLIFDYDLILKYDSSSYYYNQFLKNLIEIINNIIEEKNNRLQIISKKTIRDKLLEYFNIESKKHGSSIVYLPFTYAELADFLAIDRSAMHRELKNLKEENIIDIKGKKIILLYRHSFII
ncbi:MAG: helix-turn-helix domain-containing protein [bacterium]|nr:helix-turn-helix domain-containing protein [bacterium]